MYGNSTRAHDETLEMSKKNRRSFHAFGDGRASIAAAGGAFPILVQVQSTRQYNRSNANTPK